MLQLRFRILTVPSAKNVLIRLNGLMCAEVSENVRHVSPAQTGNYRELAHGTLPSTKRAQFAHRPESGSGTRTPKENIRYFHWKDFFPWVLCKT